VEDIMGHSNWLTRADDIKFAEETISRYIELNEGEPIGLFEVVIKPNDSVDICVADWVIELSDHFDQKYGKELGIFITKKIVSRCLAQGETMH
jgi:hypothetical protein